MFPPNTFWYDRLPHEWLPYAVHVFPQLLIELECLQNGKSEKFHSGSHFAWLDERIRNVKMPRAKAKDKVDDKSKDTRPTGNCKWINVRLEDTDVLIIEGNDVSSDDIVGWIIDMSRIGADVGVKWADAGQSRMAYAIVPDTESGTMLVGVSAYGADAFDALCALMFKVDVKLERVFAKPDDASKSRFR